MTNFNKIHLAIISIINLILITKIINIAWEGNDKAILLVIFAYSALTIVNAFVWLILKVIKKAEYKIYKTTTIGLVVLFIPTIILSSLY